MSAADTKVCSKCGVEKALTEFYKQRDSADGRKSLCKVCCNRKSRQYYRQRAARYDIVEPLAAELHPDIRCSVCGVVKSRAEFGRCATNRSWRQSYCNSCCKARTNQIRTTAEGRMARLVSTARSRAIRMGLPHNITVDNIHWPVECPVKGLALNYTSKRSKDPMLPSLDRIDPNGGYTVDNVIVVSWAANRGKSDCTIDEMRRWVALADQREEIFT